MAAFGTVDENGILWKASKPGSFCDTFGGCTNCYETLVKSAAANGPRPAAGVRNVVEQTMEGTFEKLVLSPEFEFQTYSEYFKNVENFGAGLKASIPTLEAKDTIIIYAETQRAWMLAAYGAWRQGMVVGTIYATLGEEGALFGINQSRCKLVVADAKLLKVLAKIAGRCEHLKDVISVSEPPAGAAEALKDAGINLHSMDAVIAAGAEAPCEATPSEVTEPAVLMYTSGTTGNPKACYFRTRRCLLVWLAPPRPPRRLPIVGAPTCGLTLCTLPIYRLRTSWNSLSRSRASRSDARWDMDRQARSHPPRSK